MDIMEVALVQIVDVPLSGRPAEKHTSKLCLRATRSRSRLLSEPVNLAVSFEIADEKL